MKAISKIVDIVTGTTEKSRKMKKAFGGLTNFERKLLNSWLAEMGIDVSRLSQEQNVEYSKSVVFRMLIEKVRNDKADAITIKSRLKKFFKYQIFSLGYFVAYLLILVAYVAYAYNFFK